MNLMARQVLSTGNNRYYLSKLLMKLRERTPILFIYKRFTLQYKLYCWILHYTAHCCSPVKSIPHTSFCQNFKIRRALDLKNPTDITSSTLSMLYLITHTTTIDKPILRVNNVEGEFGQQLWNSWYYLPICLQSTKT